MKGQVFRRRTEEFARLADLAADRPGGEVARQLARDPDGARLVSVTQVLREVRIDGGPDPDFRDRLRHRLVAVASVTPPAPAPRVAPATPAAGATTRTPRRPLAGSGRPRSPRLAFLAGTLAGLVLMAGLTLLVSSRALPGDTLYAVKRSGEHLELALVHGPQERGIRQLSFARTRLAEISQLVARRSGVSLGAGSRTFAAGGTVAAGDAELISRTLGDMDTDTLEGAALLTSYAVQHDSDQPLAMLAGWAAAQRATLSGLLDRLPVPADERAAVSVGLLDQLLDRVSALRRELPCACLDQAGHDQFGPKPCPPCRVPVPGGLPPGSTGSVAPPTGTGQNNRNGPSGPASPPATGGGTQTNQPGHPTLPGTPTSPAPTSVLPLPTVPVPSTTGSGILCSILGPILCTP